ncbi:MAG TPA: hypothetical protein VHK22_02430 [Gaiellaceae bacterium]|jgi:hypothetical protein|nr:hypothetical protein [Gaiellaceae bacterium]
MYDGLTGRYTFSCPAAGEVSVRLSRFRLVERLAGTAHPAVYRIRFACPCGAEHEGLVTHEELDWAPLGGSDVPFFNLMTARLEQAADELLDRAASLIRAGAWPWSFYCYPENRPQPAYPSSFRALAPADETVGVAVRCAACGQTSVNLVTHRHLDEPFYNDPSVGVVEHIFPRDRRRAVAAFREELESGTFDARRRDLAA